MCNTCDEILHFMFSKLRKVFLFLFPVKCFSFIFLFIAFQASTASLGSEQDITHSSFGGDAVIAIHKFKEHITESHDPRIDQEHIDSIEKVYFNSDDSFDSSEYELKACSHSSTGENTVMFPSFC